LPVRRNTMDVLACSHAEVATPSRRTPLRLGNCGFQQGRKSFQGLDIHHD
jgi:hypothetical protein